MRAIRTAITLASFSLLAACGGPDDEAAVPQAQPAGASFVDIGDYIVHFSAQTTDQLSPEVARTYNIVRSPNRAMLTVSVLRESDNKPVEAKVSVETVNLTGQMKNVTMRMIREQEAIYYIGETQVANQETLSFDISVQPDDVDEPASVRFQRQFYSK